MALPTKAPSIHGPYAAQRVTQEILDEIHKLRKRKLVQVVVDGAAAETNIAVAGIKKDADTIVSVVRFDKAAEGKLEGVSHVTAEAAITSDGNIQLANTNTTGDSLLVSYYDADGNA